WRLGPRESGRWSARPTRRVGLRRCRDRFGGGGVAGLLSSPRASPRPQSRRPGLAFTSVDHLEGRGWVVGWGQRPRSEERQYRQPTMAPATAVAITMVG